MRMPALLALCAAVSSGYAFAEPGSTTPAAAAEAAKPATTIANIELNKLEATDKGCRAFMVVDNLSDKTYQSFKLDLVLFQADGVIGRRFAIELAPLKPKKKSVKLFEIDGIACDKIGQFLINDVMECAAGDGTGDCLQGVTTSSKTNVKLEK